MSKRKNNSFIYIISCFVLYCLVAFIASLFSYPINEDQAMMKISGLALVLNFFATGYIRNYLMYYFNIERNEYYGESHFVENIMNILYCIVSSIVLYLLLNTKQMENDLILMLSILYFILSWPIIYFENRNNRKSELFDILKTRKSKFKCFLFPLIFSLIWAIPTVAISVIFADKISDTIGLLVLPHIYAFLIAYMYSRTNARISVTVGDIDGAGNSPTGRMYYELFLKVFFIIYFVVILFIRICIANIEYLISDFYLASTFLINIIPYMFIKWLSFDGFFSSGKLPKIKKYRVTTWYYGMFSETIIRDENGNKTRIDKMNF